MIKLVHHRLDLGQGLCASERSGPLKEPDRVFPRSCSDQTVELHFPLRINPGLRWWHPVHMHSFVVHQAADQDPTLIRRGHLLLVLKHCLHIFHGATRRLLNFLWPGCRA